MNYNEILEKDVDKNFSYNKEGYPKKLLVDGFIDLDKAKKRMEKGEYYVLVLYPNGEVLPKGYVPVIQEDSDLSEETRFATVSPDVTLSAYCNGGIQLMSRLPDDVRGARYMLGAGPDEIVLSDLVENQINAYKDLSKTR